MQFKPEIEKTVERYRRLWEFEEIDPPTVMIGAPETAADTWPHDCAFWDRPDDFVASHLPALALRQTIPDDTIPMLRPPFSHVALPAILGATPELQAGKLWVHPALARLEDYETVSFPENGQWLERFEQYYKRLLDLSEDRFAVGLYEVPAPADLMGALRGYGTVLTDFLESPESARTFALAAAEWGARFHRRVAAWVSGQDAHAGCWIDNAWAPANTVCFCEHTTINYPPALYEAFIAPANDLVLSEFEHALTYVYLRAGQHHLSHYADRGCPTWVRSCDGDPSPETAEAFRGRTIFTIHTTAKEFSHARSQYGSRGVCYHVACDSLQDASDFCAALGLG